MRDYLTSVEVLALHHALLERYSGAKGIRDMGAVEAAVFRPQCGYYADIAEEAAALLESLLINYPFIDGNKRVAFAACGRCSWSQVRRARERSTMSNRNCLEGMCCPNSTCRSYGPFQIRGKASFGVSDDGTGDYEYIEWFDHSLCTCKHCGFSPNVKDFKA